MVNQLREDIHNFRYSDYAQRYCTPSEKVSAIRKIIRKYKDMAKVVKLEFPDRRS